jgi:hypothetical protein
MISEYLLVIQDYVGLTFTEFMAMVIIGLLILLIVKVGK